MAIDKKDRSELRVRDFSRVSRKKVQAYRAILQSVDKGKKPTFRQALEQMIDYAYRDLAIKKTEDE